MTLPKALTERKHGYEIQQKQHYERIEYEKNALDAVTALLLQITMLEIAEDDPRIVKFSFDANYEYDDEGGYFWTASFFAWDAEGDTVFSDDVDSPSCDYDSDLRDCGGDGSALALAFDSGEMEGEVTIEKLRADFAGLSKGV